jgi:hypothetical protein
MLFPPPALVDLLPRTVCTYCGNSNVQKREQIGPLALRHRYGERQFYKNARRPHYETIALARQLVGASPNTAPTDFELRKRAGTSTAARQVNAPRPRRDQDAPGYRRNSGRYPGMRHSSSRPIAILSGRSDRIKYEVGILFCATIIPITKPGSPIGATNPVPLQGALCADHCEALSLIVHPARRASEKDRCR